MLQINWLYDQYVEWCKDYHVKSVATKECMGKVFGKLFGKQKLKLVQKNKDTNYNYKNVLFVKDSVREAMDSSVKLHQLMAIDFEHELVSLELPSCLMVNGSMAVFKCIYSRNTGFYRYTFRDIEIPAAALGIGDFSSWDQMFINSIATITQGLVLCRGRKMRLPKGKKQSGNLIEVMACDVGPGYVPVETTYSKNCFGVLPLTCEVNNQTCTQCIHDVNQRIRQLKTTKFLSPEEAEQLLYCDRPRRGKKRTSEEITEVEDVTIEKKVKMELDETNGDSGLGDNSDDQESNQASDEVSSLAFIGCVKPVF